MKDHIRQERIQKKISGFKEGMIRLHIFRATDINIKDSLRRLLRRPVPIMACALIWLLLFSRSLGSLDVDGDVYSCGDGKHLLISGIVEGRECTADGYRVLIDHLRFEESPGGTSSVYHFVTERLNQAVKPADKIQIFLSDGRKGNVTMYGEGEEASFWINSASSENQTELFQSLRIGDYVWFYGACSQPEPATNPGQFDSRSYYLARHIILKMSEAKLRKHGSQKKTGLPSLYVSYRNFLADLRIGMQTGLQSVFGSKDAASVAAFTLGDKSGMDSSTKMLFRNGGLSWLICVSSMHISLLGMIIYRFLRKRGISFLLSGAAAFFMVNSYALMSGFSISSQRALIMFSFWLGAQIFGRTRDTATSLAGAVIFILIRQPYALADSSFIMSVVCILSMEYLTPAIERILRPRFSLQKKICGSISIRLGALPVILWFFYQTTPYSAAVCLVVLPLMSVLLCFAILASLCGCALMATGMGLFLFAGKCFSYPCHILLFFLQQICLLERELPGSVVILGRPALWQLLVYYAGIVLFVVRVKTLSPRAFENASSRQPHRIKLLSHQLHRINLSSHRPLQIDASSRQPYHTLPGGITAFLKGKKLFAHALHRTRMISVFFLGILVFGLCVRFRPGFQFLCLDIGQGSCNLIRHGSHVYLFDAGSSSVKDIWEYRIDPVLKYYGISRVDMVFLSHGDIDHINGIEQMLEQYNRNLTGKNAGDVTIGKILLPRLPAVDDRLAPIVDSAGEHGIELGYVSEGDCFRDGDMVFSILDPSGNRITGNSNEDCIVMMITRGTLEILCMGDLEKEGEEMFVRDWKGEQKKGVRVLIAGHHGSKNATSEALLDALRPDLAFISCGKNNRYGHPARQMIERLEMAGVPYHRTDLEGAIAMEA